MLEMIRNKNDIPIYFTGGATKEELIKFGIRKRLDQDGAIYQVISPITRGKDSLEILDELITIT